MKTSLLRAFTGLKWLRGLSLLVAALALLPAALAEPVGVIVIAHPSVGPVDLQTLQRLYMGRAIEVAGVPVRPVNLPAGQGPRDRFLAAVIGETNDRYVAYWTVRRHIGKGIPPRELSSAAEVIEYVRSTPGGLGYIAVADSKPGLNVVAKP